MPLKVLLADDSAAIKKVVQLSLQDYGVELKCVGSGKDVLDVARQFHPDIAFVDVLLPHKTGYEVVAEIKKDNALKKTPVVMLWSAFMAFDEGKYKSSGADEKLEKPFEVAGLRALVLKLVPKAKPSPLAKHLDFPKMEFDQPIGSVPPSKTKSGAAAAAVAVAAEPAPAMMEPAPSAPAPTPAPMTKEEWSMASFEDIGAFSTKVTEDTPPIPEAFGEVPEEVTRVPTPDVASNHHQASSPAAKTETSSGWTGDSEWVRKDLGKFKVPIPEDTDHEDGVVPFQYSDNQVTDTSFLFKPPTGTATSIPITGAKSGAAENIKPLDVTDPKGKLTPSSTAPANPAPEPAITISTPVAQAAAAPSSAPAPATISPLAPQQESATSPSVSVKGALPEEVISELKQEARDIIERVAWKLIPELASQIIRDELQRLLGDET